MNHKKLKARREQLGLSQRKAAAKLGVSLTAYQAWEAGDVERLRKANAKALKKVFGEGIYEHA